MFAPYCPNCASRVLMGTRRLVRVSWDGSACPVVVLRCFCGGLVDGAQEPPGSADVAGAVGGSA